MAQRHNKDVEPTFVPIEMHDENVGSWKHFIRDWI